MDMGSILMLMVTYTKACGLMVSRTAMENIHTQTEMFTKECGPMANQMEKESSLTWTEKRMKACGSMEIQTDRGGGPAEMAIFLKEFGVRVE